MALKSECDVDEHGVPINYCPFLGCEVDDRGRCQHLVGFTNDKKVYEPEYKLMRASFKTGKEFDTGDRQTGGKEKVLPGDVLVNPTSLQTKPLEGTRHLANKWVSWRVYRPQSGDVLKPPDPLAPIGQPPAFVTVAEAPKSELSEVLAELRKLSGRLDQLENEATKPELAGV